MKAILRMLALLSVLLLWPAKRAQADAITHLTRSDGLLSATIHSLAAAPNGRMDIGTSAGLNLWDGKRLVSHSTGNGLPAGRIIAVQRRGNLLLAGSWGDGLGVWDGQAWQTWSKEGAIARPQWVSSLVSARRDFWVASYGDGLWRQRDGLVTQFARAGTPLLSDYITCLVSDRQGMLWIGSEHQGLQRLDPESMSWMAYPLPDGLTEVTALCAQDGYLWVGTRQGLARLETVNGTWVFLGRAAGLKSPHIAALAAMPDGTLAIGTFDGLFWHREGSISAHAQGPLAYLPISALSCDTEGHLWVGTLTDGLYVLDERVPHGPARLPVVLVHGWRGPDSDLLQDSEFWHLARWLRDDGFDPYYAQGISPEQTLHQNAARLAQVIAQARQDTGADQVYVIAFSMGGLNTRAYLESSLYQGDVAHVFILGTPHRGEHLWLPFLAWEAAAWSDEPSAVELWPIHEELMAQLAAPNPMVPYTLIAGEAEANLLPTLFSELPPSDGLVSTWSALGLAGENITYRLTPDIHAWSADTLVLDLPTLLLPRTTYDAHIRPILFATGDQTAPGQLVNSTSYAKPPAQPQSAWRTGTIQPGQTLRLADIPVEQAQRMGVHVRWQGEPLTVTLRSPDGRQINDAKADDRDDIEYLSLDFADYAGYVLTDTMPGDWGVVLQAATDASTSSDYVAYATFGGPLDLQGETDQSWYGVGEPITVRARLTGTERNTTISMMQALIIGPDGSQRSVLLQRERVDGDYGAEFTADQSGYHLALLSATGNQAGANFERSCLLLFGVRSVAGAIDLPVRRIDTPERHGLEFGMRVKKPGSFLISLGLMASDGRQGRIAHPVTLAVGQHQVFVPWSDEFAWRDRVEVTDVRLAEISGPAVLIDMIPHPRVIVGTEEP